MSLDTFLQSSQYDLTQKSNRINGLEFDSDGYEWKHDIGTFAFIKQHAYKTLDLGF